MGLSIEGKHICYESTWNKILGFCCEHLEQQKLKTEFANMETVHTLKCALDNDLAHYGKNAAVFVLAPHSAEGEYWPFPIVTSPLCKGETAVELAKTLHLILDVWHDHPCGKILHGPICAVASDGDSPFPAACQALCTEKEETVPGLNRYTSAEGVAGSGNYKHCDRCKLLKASRVCADNFNTGFWTLVRNPKGVQLFGVYLSKEDIHAALLMLPDKT
jgi:hypothetical protein